MALVVAISLSMAVSAFALENNDNTEPSISRTEEIVDSEGNSFELVYSVAENTAEADSYAALYHDGVLLQETYVFPTENRVVEYDHTTSIFGATGSSPLVTEYVYSDLFSALPEVETDESFEIDEDYAAQFEVNVPFPVFSSEGGWTLVNSWPAAPASPYPIDLYTRNYDDEPDQNRFERKTLSFPAKVAVTTVAGVLAGFITTGGITVAIVVRAFGAAIIKEGTQQVINRKIEGAVCYSTQKIRYAPVVEGYNIYPNAYITKLWLVAENALTQKTDISLANAAYEYSPQPSQEDLMFAARHYFTDWAQSNGYTK